MSDVPSPHGPYPTHTFLPPAAGQGRHKLLERQLRRIYGEAVPPACRPLLDAVDAAYRQFDDERALIERSLELTSEELLERNERLRAELTEREQTEEALRRYVVRLDQAQRIAGLGYWEWDAHHGITSCADDLLRLFGYEPGTVRPTMEWFFEHMFEEEIPTFVALLQTTRPGTPCEIEHRITRSDGAVRTLFVSMAVLAEHNGVPTHVFGVSMDVTERKRYEQALVEAKEQAEAARRQAEEMLQLKSAFLNNMSHELRTPLTGILGFAEILAEEVDPEHGEIVSIITNSARRLTNTLNSVLDLAQLESNTIELAARPVALAAEVREALATLRPLADRKGLALHAHLDIGATALADAAALHRVLNNLVGNAIKFTERGSVTVRVEREGRGDGDGASFEPASVCLHVSDTGLGIEEAFLPHLFEEFKQASTGYGRIHEGNGLGLAITKRLVDLMGGAITVASTLGKGTTFTVRLRLAPFDGVEVNDPRVPIAPR